MVTCDVPLQQHTSCVSFSASAIDVPAAVVMLLLSQAVHTAYTTMHSIDAVLAVVSVLARGGPRFVMHLAPLTWQPSDAR